MIKQIFVNLPVKDVQKSKAFFNALGFTFNEKFTDEKAACVVLGENIFAMLLKEDFFRTFTNKTIAATATQTEVMNAIELPVKADVDAMIEKVVAAGGKDLRKVDYGWMYSRAFEDVDGHIWEVFWSDEKQFKKAV